MMKWLFIALLCSGCASTSRDIAPLRIVSWNLEHLAEADGSGCRPRSETDYAAMRDFVRRIDGDVIAFQEVESAAAAERVFDPAIYTIIIETRPGSTSRPECRGLPGHFLNRQGVGFAIRRGLEIERREDVTALQLGDPDLRSGVDVEVGRPGGARIRLLAVHLKSGCASGDSSEACAILFRQIPILEDWIDARAGAEIRFAVLGDFNRRLAAPHDAIWADLNDGEPAGAALVSGETPATCDQRYPAFIDHILVPAADFERGDFREWTFEAEKLSDHCPVSTEIRF